MIEPPTPGAVLRYGCRCAVALLGTLWLCSPAVVLAQQVRFTYSAQDEWADSQIMLLPGDRVVVDTSANWCNVGPPDAMFDQKGYPGGPIIAGTYLPTAPLGLALARIADDIWPAIDRTIDVTKPGHLLFAMNDVPGSASYGDNRGAATVTIRLALQPAVMRSFKDGRVVDAEKFLAPWGLKPDVQTGPSDLAEGVIYDQRPQAGVDLHTAPLPVVLYVAATKPPPPPPPSPEETPPLTVSVTQVVGDPVDVAESRLQSDHLVGVYAGDEPSARVRGIVTRTDPAAGKTVKPGSPVHYWLASGDNVVPDVTEKTSASARDVLSASGFNFVGEVLEYDAGPAATVWRQSPSAGELVPLKTEIVLTVRHSLWPLLVIGTLGLAAAGGAALKFSRWRRHVRTKRLVHVQASLDSRTDTALPDDIPSSAVEVKVTLIAGNTVFSKPPGILSSEVRDA